MPTIKELAQQMQAQNQEQAREELKKEQAREELKNLLILAKIYMTIMQHPQNNPSLQELQDSDVDLKIAPESLLVTYKSLIIENFMTQSYVE